MKSMTAFVAITLTDGAATPVARSFTPVRIDAMGVAKYADKSAGIPVGFPVVTLNLREPNKQSKTYRVTGKVDFPVLEQTSASTASGIQPAPTVAYRLLGNFDFTLPERSTLVDRKNVLALTKNLVAHALLTSMAVDLDSIY